jgi:hypothetical protein
MPCDGTWDGRHLIVMILGRSAIHFSMSIEMKTRRGLPSSGEKRMAETIITCCSAGGGVAMIL